MKKITWFFLFVLMLVNASSLMGQNFYELTQEKAVDFKGRVLLVSLLEENPKEVKKLRKDPERLKFYQNQIQGFNQAFKQAVSTHWTFNTQIEYLPESQVKAMVKENRDKYCRIGFGYEPSYFTEDDKKSGWSKEGDAFKYDSSIRYTGCATRVSSISIGTKYDWFEVYLPNEAISYGDLVYGVQQMQGTLKYVHLSKSHLSSQYLSEESAKNAALLGKLTLLIDNREADPALSETLLKKLYPYPVRLVEYQTIEKAILEQSPEYAVLHLVPTITHYNEQGVTHSTNAFIIATAQDGRVCMIDFPGLVKKGPKHPDPDYTYTWSPRLKKNNAERIAAYFSRTHTN
jgi:hypothetical protein